MGYYALWVALRLVLPGALLCCGLLVMWRVSGLLRVVGLVLLGIGACAIVLAALSGAIRSPTPLNAPALIAALVVFPLAGIALVRSAAPRGRRLSSAHAASTLLILAAVVQFFAPWLLASGE